jgi:thiol-disulfide isomerase/thioredoxin
VGAEEEASAVSLHGQVVVLHFWATWCGPCRAEFPEFAKYAETVDRKGGVRTLAVSLDDREEVAMVWALRNGGGIQVWHDSKELAGALGVEAIPTTVLLDKEGRIAYQEAGVQNWTASGVPKRVEELRGE